MSTRFLHSSDKGFSIVEMIVTVALGMIVTGVALSQFESTHRMVRFDMERTSLNQNLRSAMDIMGMNVRLAGENLPGFFPAVVIDNGADGAADTFTIRRAILDENMISCQGLNAGSFLPLFFADATSPSADCTYGNKADILTAWQNYRTGMGGQGLAYVYDRVTNAGQFFEWTGEFDNLSQMYIVPVGQWWTNNYTAEQTFAYAIEEWRFSLVGDTIQMVIDNDTANPINVVNAITDFQVTATLSDNSVVTTFQPGTDWSNLALINISLTGREVSAGEQIVKNLDASFLPRNVLSN